MRQFFGHLGDGEMRFNDICKFTSEYWMQIPEDLLLVELGDFVIIPNHNSGGITGNKHPVLIENLAKIIPWHKGKTSVQWQKNNGLSPK